MTERELGLIGRSGDAVLEDDRHLLDEAGTARAIGVARAARAPDEVRAQAIGRPEREVEQVVAGVKLGDIGARKTVDRDVLRVDDRRRWILVFLVSGTTCGDRRGCRENENHFHIHYE